MIVQITIVTFILLGSSKKHLIEYVKISFAVILTANSWLKKDSTEDQ